MKVMLEIDLGINNEYQESMYKDRIKRLEPGTILWILSREEVTVAVGMLEKVWVEQ